MSKKRNFRSKERLGRATSSSTVRPERKQSSVKLISSTSSKLPDPMLTSRVPERLSIAIKRVGIAEFKIPLSIKSGKKVSAINALITAQVDLAAEKRGIHMSRLVEVLYQQREKPIRALSLEKLLRTFQSKLSCGAAFLKVAFDYQIEQISLRSKLYSIQYVPVTLSACLSPDGQVRGFLRLDFNYSSTCPCSQELAEQARAEQGIITAPHSQRSTAEVLLELDLPSSLSLEAVHEICRRSLVTETQVLVKRPDEQAFALLNGANPKFVEDAVRLLYDELESQRGIVGFKINCSHFESLHNHNAVATIEKAPPRGFPEFLFST